MIRRFKCLGYVGRFGRDAEQLVAVFVEREVGDIEGRRRCPRSGRSGRRSVVASDHPRLVTGVRADRSFPR